MTLHYTRNLSKYIVIKSNRFEIKLIKSNPMLCLKKKVFTQIIKKIIIIK